MFDGDIICQSQVGQGSTFTFIVAIMSTLNNSSVMESSMNDRILNPIQEKYEKINLKEMYANAKIAIDHQL